MDSKDRTIAAKKERKKRYETISLPHRDHRYHCRVKQTQKAMERRGRSRNRGQEIEKERGKRRASPFQNERKSKHAYDRDKSLSLSLSRLLPSFPPLFQTYIQTHTWANAESYPTDSAFLFHQIERKPNENAPRNGENGIYTYLLLHIFIQADLLQQVKCDERVEAKKKKVEYTIAYLPTLPWGCM